MGDGNGGERKTRRPAEPLGREIKGYLGLAGKRCADYMEVLGWKDAEAPQAQMLRQLCTESADALDQVLRKAEDIKGDLARIGIAVRRGPGMLNSLGELQHGPAALNAAVGAYNMAEVLLHGFLRIYGYTGEIP